jgi:hypothetical protein
MTDTKPFWEIDHPYKAPEGNYYANHYQLQDSREEFDSFQELLDFVSDLDVDYNYLYRWDYVAPDPDDYEEDEEEIPEPHLAFCYIQQRRGSFLWLKLNSPSIEDEAAIRAYLEARWEYVKRTWAPLV